jgi:hypothetical protein
VAIVKTIYNFYNSIFDAIKINAELIDKKFQCLCSGAGFVDIKLVRVITNYHIMKRQMHTR